MNSLPPWLPPISPLSFFLFVPRRRAAGAAPFILCALGVGACVVTVVYRRCIVFLWGFLGRLGTLGHGRLLVLVLILVVLWVVRS